MKTLLALSLLSASLAAAAPAPTPVSRPSFFETESPWQMTGQATSGILTALVGGMVAGAYMETHASHKCREDVDPDFTDECGWSGLDGFVTGFLIGAPIGHSLGTWLAGSLQGKQGAGIAAVSALAGDVAIFFLAQAAHNAIDGKLLPNGRLDPFLVPVSTMSMLAIPVATQSLYDYQVRFPLHPRITLGATLEKTRYAMDLVQVGF